MSLLAELRARLPQTPQEIALRDDVDMELSHPDPAAARAVEASVLLPVIGRAQPTLLFTRRTATLARHSGQVSFPGGRREPHDISPLETALRETFEETGIAPGLVNVAGYLHRYVTGTGFDIQPVVGFLDQDFALAPDPREVDEVFEVPLDFLLDPANRRRESREIAGRQRRFYAFTYQGHEIWGVTAAIIVNLAERLNSKMV